MNWIEIMGPSGIGKSTFLDGYYKHRKGSKKWVLLDEGMDELIQKNHFKGLSNQLLKFYFHQDYINTKKKICGNYFC